MREILFRGKRADNGEWAYGYYAHRPTAVCIGESNPSCIYAPACNPDDNSEFIEVIPETVGQYTGLKDKNGKKIFEGDIVSGTAYSSEWIGEIVWIDEIASFGVRYFHRTDPTAWENSSILKAVSMGRQDKFAAKIIGNIHDNPGLLEDGDK